MPLTVADYIADTQHLSLQQHGAYLLILMTMWRHGGWIDDDDKKLARICKLTSVSRWKKIAPAIRALLVERDGKLSQKRLLKEYGVKTQKLSLLRQNLCTDPGANYLKNKEPTATNGKSDLLVPLSIEEVVSKKERESARSKRPRSPRIQMPEDWRPNDDGTAYAGERGFDVNRIEQMIRACRDYHIKHGTLIAGERGLAATWRTWVENEIKFSKPKPQQHWMQQRDETEMYLKQMRERARHGTEEANRKAISGPAVSRIDSDVSSRTMAAPVTERPGDIRKSDS